MDFSNDNGGVPAMPQVGGLDAVTRAEIDIQISTAHAYPRQISRVANNVKSLVSMSKETAEGCIFSLPRGGKPIVGPSIRLAEILFSQWGNCTGGSRTIEVNRKDGYVECEGVFHDLQTNAKTVRRVRRSIASANGRVYSNDMIIVTSNAAGAIAFRNAVLAGVPRPVWQDAYAYAEDLIRGDIKTLPERRDRALKVMSSFGLTAEDVCGIVGVNGVEDIDLDALLVLAGLHNSLKEGDTTAEKLRAEIKAKNAVEEAPAQRKIENKTKTTGKTATRDRKPVDRTPPPPADPEPEPDHDPETGEVDDGDVTDDTDIPGDYTGEEEQAAQGDMLGGTPQQEGKRDWGNLLNAILADVDERGAPLDAAMGFYGPKVRELDEKNPELLDEFIKVTGHDLRAALNG
ncbi:MULTISPECIES: hypothetical protein [unclassified Mameliella]|uniref:hypothetical protein n=1 Tax=Mameliella sp. LZ-28 TaxID=2484146 RepID=UPI00143FA4AF|nr:hypothetical protein [Mameliella sp. LZ-28]MCR9276212.1 hypothetical protein [Paracoccaceae bacterium]